MLTVGGFVGAARESKMARAFDARRLEYSAAAVAATIDNGAAHSPGTQHRDRAAAQYTRAGEIRRELMQPLVMSVMPAMFVWLRWTALSQPSVGRFWPFPACRDDRVVVVAFFVTFFVGFILEVEWGLMPGTGPYAAADRLWSVGARSNSAWRAKRARPPRRSRRDGAHLARSRVRIAVV